LRDRLREIAQLDSSLGGFNINTKVSIVISSLNEKQNLPAMLAGLKKSLKGHGCEYKIVIVDGY